MYAWSINTQLCEKLWHVGCIFTCFWLVKILATQLCNKYTNTCNTIYIQLLHTMLFVGLQIVFHRYFHGNSVTDGGTLGQLRCLIHCHNITNNVSKEMNELEDFKSVGRAHVMAAALTFFDMDATDEEPKEHAWPPELLAVASADLRWEYLHDILGIFVDH